LLEFREVAPGFFFWPSKGTSHSQDHTEKSSASPVLVVLLTWLFCKPANAAKYVHLYTSRGFDVLHISSSLSHFVWPLNSKTFAVKITEVLKSQFLHYGEIIVHASSVGAYNYTTMLMLSEENPDVKLFFVDKVKAVIFDSLTMGTLDHMMHGIAVGASSSRVVQTLTTSIASFYFLLMRKHTVDAFNEGVSFFKSKPLCVPTLLFGCENDPMCDKEALKHMVSKWKNKGQFPLSVQVWEKSGHCTHLIHHRKQYEQLLDTFLASLENAQYKVLPKKISSKL
jgi:hypothetical protein